MYERLSSYSNLILQELHKAKDRSIDMLDLSVLHLGATRVETLIQIIQAIPQSSTCVNLSGNDFGRMKGADIARVFQSLPETVTTIDVSDNDLDLMSADALVQFMQSIPKSVSTLNLGSNSLGRRSVGTVSRIFQAIPGSIKSLNLRGNDLFHLGDNLPIVLQNLSPNLESLDLSLNYFDKLRPDTIVNSLKAIPRGVKVLAMGMNFSHMNIEILSALPTIFSAYPSGVTHLDFSVNQFVRGIQYGDGEISGRALNALTPNVASLDLSSSELFACEASNLARTLSQLSGTVIILDLGLNQLGKMNDNDLKEILCAIPDTLKVLSLRGNGLGEKSIEQLRLALTALHKELVFIDLSENQFKPEVEQELIGMFSSSAKVSLQSRSGGLKEAYESTLLKAEAAASSQEEHASSAGLSSESPTDSMGGANSPSSQRGVDVESPYKFFVHSSRSLATSGRGDQDRRRHKTFNSTVRQLDDPSGVDTDPTVTPPSRRKSI